MKTMIMRMEPCDINEVKALSDRVFGSMAWSERDLLHATGSEYDLPMVLRIGTELAGFCMLRYLGPEAEIQEICVAEHFRNRGLGRLMMERMLDIARERGSSSIFLEVRVGNTTAKALYESLGFREMYIRNGYYTDPVEDGAVMRLAI